MSIIVELDLRARLLIEVRVRHSAELLVLQRRVLQVDIKPANVTVC